VNLAAVVLVERRAQQALMLGKHLGVAATQPRQQPRRTLDVAKQERDGATRKLRHTLSYAQSPPRVKRRPPAGLSQRRSRIEQEHRSTVNRCASSLLVLDEGSRLPHLANAPLTIASDDNRQRPRSPTEP
jgi:hypothetical protein